jgi:L-rhamnose isomerase
MAERPFFRKVFQMTDTNYRIARQLFEHAITLIKKTCFHEPDNVDDEDAVAKLIAGKIKYDTHTSYDYIEQLMVELNDNQCRESFNRINEVHNARWE